jgi:hypothetical protein
MKPDRPQHGHPLAYVIAQQYSSITFFPLRALQKHCMAFCNFFEKLVSLKLPFLMLPKSDSVCTHRKVLAINI